jgi:hypothetical protein
MSKSTLTQIQDKALYDLNNIIEFAEEHDLVNSQEFINFLDKLNEISVRY